MKHSRILRVLLRTAIASIISLLTIAIIEMILRLQESFIPNPWEKQANFFEQCNGYRRMRPNLALTVWNGISLFTDQNGFRISSPRKSQDIIGKHSILLLGDSFSMGWRVRANESFGELMAKQLGCILHNASCYGLDAQEEANLLMDILEPDTHHIFQSLKPRPTLIVWQLFGNDIIPASVVPARTAERPDTLIRPTPAKEYLRTHLFRKTWPLLSVTIKHVLLKIGLIQPITPEQNPTYALAQWGGLYPSKHYPQAWKNFREIFKEVVTKLQKQGIKLVVLVIPYESQVSEEYRKEIFRQLFLKIPSELTQATHFQNEIQLLGAHCSIIIVDPLAALKIAEHQNHTYIKYDYHLTPYGHQVVARSLIQTIQPLVTDTTSHK